MRYLKLFEFFVTEKSAKPTIAPPITKPEKPKTRPIEKPSINPKPKAETETKPVTRPVKPKKPGTIQKPEVNPGTKAISEGDVANRFIEEIITSGDSVKNYIK